MATLGNISFNIKNEYDATATYLKDDIVHYNGQWHLCTTDTTAGFNPDSHAGYWDTWQSMFNWRGAYSHAGSTAYNINDVVQVDVPMYIETKSGRMQSGLNVGSQHPYTRKGGEAVSPTVVASVTVTVGGSGYTSVPTVTIGGVTSGGASAQATATAIVVGGVVTRIDVVTNGVGYSTVPDVVFSGGGGTLAAATAVLTDISKYFGKGLSKTGSLVENKEFVSESTYICTTAVTLPASPTESDYPYANNSNWDLVTSEHDFDDTEVLDVQTWNPDGNSGKGQLDNAVKKVQHDHGVWTGNYRDCIKLPNKGLVGDNSPYYALGDNKQSTVWHGKGYINGAGGVTRWGSNDGAACAFEHDIYTAIETSHDFLDWFTSTDHKEWDSFLDGYIEEFRIMNNIPANTTVPLAPIGTDIFTDLLIQSGSEADGEKTFTDIGQGTFPVMPHETLAPDSGDIRNHNDYNRTPDGANKTSGWNQVQHTTEEALFGTSSIRFGGDGDYLRLKADVKWDQFVTSGVNGYIDFHIKLKDGGKGRGRQAIVEQYYQKDYYWALYYREHYGFNFEIWWDGSMRFQTGWGGEIFDEDWYFIRLVKTTGDDYQIWKQANGAGGLQGTTSTNLSAICTGNYTTSHQMRVGSTAVPSFTTGSLWIGGRGGTSPHNTPDAEPPKCVQLEVGDNHMLMLFNNGEVYHGGHGGEGQTGDGSNSTRSYMARCGGTYSEVYRRYDGGFDADHHTTYRTRFVRIATSGGQRQENNHSCYAIDEDGWVWSWGYNGYGQLGHTGTTNVNYPKRIDDGTVAGSTKSSFNSFGSGYAIQGIWAAGQEYGYVHAVDENGGLWAFGNNDNGQLGTGDVADRSSPQLIDSGTWVDGTRGAIRKVQQCSGGNNSSTAILTSTGEIWVTGYNAQGWHCMDNTTQLTSFTRCTFGPGSATWVGHADNVTGSTKAVNIWYTGNGNHVNLWIRDDLGYQWVAGRNAYEVHGNYLGNTTNSHKPELVYIALPDPVHTPAIAGTTQRVHMRNVRSMGCNLFEGADYDGMGVTVVTDEGNSWVSGRGDYGSQSTGNATSATHIGGLSDGAHGIEIQNNGWFQPLRGASFAQGHFVDVVGTGHRQSNDPFWMTLWQTDRNRCMKAGRSDRGAGQHIGSSVHQRHVDPYIMDGVYN